jgi:RNA polymerase sigma-70 factor (ECF subfamily)
MSPAGETAHPPDEELMTRYRRGDRGAFRALFDRHAGKLFGFLLRHVGERALAEDLLQQTWLKVHRARDEFRDGAPFAPWLYAIANNVRRDAGRARRRERTELTKDGGVPEAAAPTPTRGEGSDRVQLALAALPEGQREVIILHRWHDLSFAEIAAVLGGDATEGAVRVRAHRGYVALRELLAKQPVEEVQR